MSASNKKKLRKEQETARLTEKQLAAQQEVKKTNLYTIAFVSVMVAILVIAIVVGINQIIVGSGIREKNTTAVTLGDYELTNAELSYFYMDAVNNFSSQYGALASMIGLDVSMPLDEQVINEETGATWADDFLDTAIENARAAYALCDAAKAAGFTLDEAEQANIDMAVENLDVYAAMYGYPDGKTYLKAVFGNGATLEGFRKYCETTALATAYQSHYTTGLTFSADDIQAADAEDPATYSSYTYNAYYLPISKFQQGGTETENGITYSDEEKAAAVTAAETAAKELASGKYATAAEFDAAIAALEVNKDTTASSSEYADTRYGTVNSLYVDWVSDSSRKAGDMTWVQSASTSTGEDGTETTTVNGYYIVYYVACNDNSFALKNVRHILISFAGGVTDSTTGTTTYTDVEKNLTKTEAETLLEEWKNGDATEESFAQLANERSNDGDGTTGGLYENVYPGQMVTNFNDWCFDESRKSGDTGIVETEYGYHIMYFVGDGDSTYRNYLVENTLRNNTTQAWYDELIAQLPAEKVDTRYIRTDLVLAG